MTRREEDWRGEAPPIPAARLAALVFDALPSGVIVHDARGVALAANPQAATLLGVEPQAIPGRTATEYLAAHPQAARAIAAELELATRGAGGDLAPPPADRRRLRLAVAGQERVLSLAVLPLAPLDPGAGYLALVLDDVSAHHDEIASLRALQTHVEKMAALGDLLAGVAHEINTPLGAVNSNHDVFVRSTAKLREVAEGVAGAPRQALGRLIQVFEDLNRVNAEALGRILKLVGGLRSFARREEAAEEIDIHDRIEDTLSLIEHQTKGRIEVARDYGADLPRLVCYPSLMSQVLLNILVNAVHAIEGKGRIVIRTRSLSGAQGIRIEIADTGRGMPPEIIDRIFEPGFTTKERGHGTGLGLPISRRIVERHGGRIEVESRVGKGSTFSIILPLDCASQPPPPPGDEEGP